ncbi:MAG: hypothetical protein WB774_20195, partial [Xanthobacteraceae bacterium]
LIHKFSGVSRFKKLRIFGRTTLEIQFIYARPFLHVPSALKFGDFFGRHYSTPESRDESSAG